MASSLSAVVNALTRYEVYEYGLLLNYVAEATAVMVIATYVTAFTNGKYFKKRLVLIAWSIVFASLYSFGGAILINCYYDKTTPQVFTEPVIDKYILHGKNTSYDIYIPARGKYKTRQYFSVGKTKYSKIQLGDTVFVYLYGGKLHIPWYRLPLK